ncbi:uncharacterized protein LOC127854806 [Dreissena polymorpha]|uniref:Protein quiver n=1 Tax=Dreissena polymorpha TaxID=45954 RepID=A0A9D4HJA7_DREPO|nr:uncharacterized protein LOC127854806 [Dreissena polymorpha]KAH3719508.1 hypothetical protein DPMN_062345 [Dreissena polymorpha]
MFAVVSIRCLAVLAMFVLIQEGCALKCYTCISWNNTDCGQTFNLQGANAKAALTECQGSNAACRKVVIRDTHKHFEITTRDCYVMRFNVTMEKLKCTDLMISGESCYCNTDGCNSQTANVASLAVVFTSLIMFFGFNY